MIIFLQLITILGMLGLTYVAFTAFGKPSKSLLFTLEQKQSWDRQVNTSLGAWYTKTNIIGTLTSLATVYVFFIGSSKLFGFWIFLCSLTIWGGAYITNYFTRKICSDPYVKRILSSSKQTGGVISCLFWRPDDPRAQTTSLIIKWISMVNIIAVIWFEFSIFTQISSNLLEQHSLLSKLLLLGGCCFAVTFFTLRYGLRGFVFADFFQTPMIVISAVILLVGVLILYSNSDSMINMGFDIFNPLLTTKECILFAIQVISLNFFLVMATESHWLRVWIFGMQETKVQAKATLYTGILWGLLALVGLVAFNFTAPALGVSSLSILLTKLSELSNLFLVAFWIGGMAALFSTTDSQIYSFLVVQQFDNSTGELHDSSFGRLAPVFTSIWITVLFVIIFSIVDHFKLPFEKIIFISIPLCLNILPAFVLASLNKKQNYVYILISLFLYISCCILGFNQASNEYSWTLLAPFCPIAISLLLYIFNISKSVSK